MVTPSKPNLANKDWYAIACKIRKQNEDLKKKITELETLIEAQKQQIKVQVIKNKDHEKINLNYEAVIKDLEKKINENYLRINEQNEQYEKQKLVMENLIKELKQTQQLAANLERDCSLLQDTYNESQYQLKQKEKENKELQTRLQRQQRYNAQYKTALDQYLTSNSTTAPNVNSLGIESWSENNFSVDNDVSEDVQQPSLLDKIDQEIAEIDNNLEENNMNIQQQNREEKTIPKAPFFPSLKQDNSQESYNGKEQKPRNKSFLKLPKFGK